MEPFLRIEPEEFLKKLEKEGLQDALFIDVREPFEWEYYHLEEADLIPMNTIPVRMNELPRDKTIYVVCAHGVRSANVCYYLQQNGFEQATNVEGGMAALAQLKGFAYD
jgi:rhodanese-related sulfurtransferase